MTNTFISDISDGKLECVGLTGLTHLSNVFAGIRSGIRIGKLKIILIERFRFTFSELFPI